MRASIRRQHLIEEPPLAIQNFAAWRGSVVGEVLRRWQIRRQPESCNDPRQDKRGEATCQPPPSKAPTRATSSQSRAQVFHTNNFRVIWLATGNLPHPNRLARLQQQSCQSLIHNKNRSGMEAQYFSRAHQRYIIIVEKFKAPVFKTRLFSILKVICSLC